jgi:hypothetical protein
MHKLDQSAHIIILDVPAVFAQVNRDAIRAAQVRFDRGPDRVGFIRPPRLPNGGDVVDVHPKFDSGFAHVQQSVG